MKDESQERKAAETQLVFNRTQMANSGVSCTGSFLKSLRWPYKNQVRLS